MPFESPEETRPLPCGRCEHAFAEVDSQCPPCACMSRIDNDDLPGAFALASDYGIDVVAVGMMIESSVRHRLRAELHNSTFRAMRAEVRAASHAANDTGLEYGYYRLRATKEHGEMYCPPCLRGLAIDPHGPCSDWTALDASTARGGHCEACGESLDALPSVPSVAL